MDTVSTWIVSREDLILSMLVWAKEASSELQLRDVRSLLDESVDRHTSPGIEAIVRERYRSMAPDERVRIAAAMFDTARAIVLSSLPPELDRRQRRLALARRLYGDELPEAALIRFAEWPTDE